MDNQVSPDDMGTDREQNSYSVSVKGNGLTMERITDEATALAILQLLMKGGATLPPASPERPRASRGDSAFPPHSQANPSSPSEKTVDRRLSLREYFDSVGAKNNISKIVAIGAYLRDHEDQADFSRDDLVSRFRSARETAPANLSRDLQKAIRQNWIAEDPHNKNQFYVTTAGDKAAEAGFEGTRSSPARKRSAKRPKTAGHTGEDEAAD